MSEKKIDADNLSGVNGVFKDMSGESENYPKEKNKN